MSLGWLFKNEADWCWWIHEKEIIKKNPRKKAEYASDNSSDTEKYGAVYSTVVTV